MAKFFSLVPLFQRLFVCESFTVAQDTNTCCRCNSSSALHEAPVGEFEWRTALSKGPQFGNIDTVCRSAYCNSSSRIFMSSSPLSFLVLNNNIFHIKSKGPSKLNKKIRDGGVTFFFLLHLSCYNFLKYEDRKLFWQRYMHPFFVLGGIFNIPFVKKKDVISANWSSSLHLKWNFIGSHGTLQQESAGLQKQTFLAAWHVVLTELSMWVSVL